MDLNGKKTTRMFRSSPWYAWTSIILSHENFAANNKPPKSTELKQFTHLQLLSYVLLQIIPGILFPFQRHHSAVRAQSACVKRSFCSSLTEMSDDYMTKNASWTHQSALFV